MDFKNCPGSAQHRLPRLAHLIQLVSSLVLKIWSVREGKESS